MRRGPPGLERYARRLPYSRWSALVPLLLGGRETIVWRDVPVDVDVAEAWGYALFMFPEAPEAEFEWLAARCRRASLFADVGAHLGIYSLALARLHPDLRVVAFEPDPALARSIQAAIDRAPALQHRVQVVQAAAGAASGRASFRPAIGINNAVGRLVASAPGAAGLIDVDVVPLGIYFGERSTTPDVLKLDVEGAEVDALRGLFDAGCFPRAILIEAHPALFGDGEVTTYQAELLAVLRRSRYACEFLLNETDRAAELSTTTRWPSRTHLFAVRD